jgi:hypothetical protein
MGSRYYVKAGQSAGASVTAPSGTTADNACWGYVGPGGTYNGIVTWTSGTAFREGGSYKTDGQNARNCFVGCYAEGDQNPPQIGYPSLISGGMLSSSAGAGVIDVGPSPGFVRVGGLTATGPANVAGNIAGSGPINALGPSTGAVANNLLNLRATGDYNEISMYSYNGGTFKVVGMGSQRAVGSYTDLTTTAGGTHRYVFNGGGITTLRTGAIDINGSQVVGPRGAAVADATDGASAITQLNALLARLRAHGLIAT